MSSYSNHPENSRMYETTIDYNDTNFTSGNQDEVTDILHDQNNQISQSYNQNIISAHYTSKEEHRNQNFDQTLMPNVQNVNEATSNMYKTNQTLIPNLEQNVNEVTSNVFKRSFDQTPLQNQAENINEVTSNVFKRSFDRTPIQNQTENINEVTSNVFKRSFDQTPIQNQAENINKITSNKTEQNMNSQQQDELLGSEVKEEIVVNLDPLNHYGQDEPVEEPFSLSCTFCKQSFPTVTELMQHRITHITDFYHQDNLNLPSVANITNNYHSIFGNYGLINGASSVTTAITEQINPIPTPEKPALNVQKQLAELEKPYPCPICGKRLSNKSSLSRHKSAHSQTTTFQCDICQKTFTRKGHLETHKKLHTGIKPFECEICLKIFSQQNYLNDHMKRHSDEKNYSCTICWKRFKSNSAFRTHESVVHATERKFKCTFEDCGKTFTRKAQWQLHERIHNGIKPFQCNVCQRHFARNCTLQEHLLTHSDVKPFFCEICNKQYARKTQLQLHMRIHSDVKPFACVECGKQYTLMSSLKYHMKIHESAEDHLKRNEMRRLIRKSRSYKGLNVVFICDICGQSYSRKNQISIHLRKVHPKLWERSEPIG